MDGGLVKSAKNHASEVLSGTLGIADAWDMLATSTTWGTMAERRVVLSSDSELAGAGWLSEWRRSRSVVHGWRLVSSLAVVVKVSRLPNFKGVISSALS